MTVHARRADQAQALAESLGVTAGEWPPPAGSWDVLVNCTPLGERGSATSRRFRASSCQGRWSTT